MNRPKVRDTLQRLESSAMMQSNHLSADPTVQGVGQRRPSAIRSFDQPVPGATSLLDAASVARRMWTSVRRKRLTSRGNSSNQCDCRMVRTEAAQAFAVLSPCLLFSLSDAALA